MDKSPTVRPTTERQMIEEAYTRGFVDADAINSSIAFYKALLSGEQTLRFA